MCLGMVLPAMAAPDNELSAEALRVIEQQSEKKKVNTIVTTDGEIDDMDSFLRYLTYANEFNTKAIILTSSTFHWAGGTVKMPDGSEGTTYTQSRWTGVTWPYVFFDKYEESYSKLSQHDPAYPTADYLRSIYAVGNIKYRGEMDEITAGSELIKKTILENPNGEDLYVQIWGGSNTLARALRSIEEEYKDTPEWDRIYRKVSDEVMSHMILNQDATYSNYIAVNWPEIRFINNSGVFWSFAYQHGSRVPAATRALYFEKAWTDTIREIGSPLLSEYLTAGGGWDLRNLGRNENHPFYIPVSEEYPNADTWGENENRGLAGNESRWTYNFISEGDSPAYFFLIDNGLRTYENPTWGGWPGRFSQVNERLWRDNAQDRQENGTYNNNWTFIRWFPDIQTDFTARAQWTIADYNDANHTPKSGVMNGLDITGYAGETITLDGVAYDPDGNELSYNWWQYHEADTYAGEIELHNSDQASASFTIPEDANIGDTIHLIFEVKDDAKNPMKTYKRVVLTVTEEPVETEVSIYLDGDESVLAGRDASYTVSARNMERLATATVWVEVDGTYLSSQEAVGLNGFDVLSSSWSHKGGTTWEGRFTLTNLEGGITSKDMLEILHLPFSSSGELGIGDVKITRVELSGYDENNTAIFFDSDIKKDIVSTEFEKEYSKYDVNRDGTINQLDLTTAQIHYGMQEGDENWNQYADVNDDGKVDVEDLILILNNIVW